MRPREVSNPPNPFESTSVEWLEAPPEQPFRVYEDASRTILAKNDSPDLSFTWSVNPYRGCQHACAYCVVGDTPILMADGRTRAIADVRVGDEIYGTRRRGHYRRYVRTRVLAHFGSVKPAYRVLLEDGTQLVASADHRFLSNRGWKHVTGAEQGPLCRPHLTTSNSLLGTGQLAAAPQESPAYREGYLCGLIRGDGLIGTYDYSGRRRGADVQHQFRLALADLEALHRARGYLRELAVPTHAFVFQEAVAGRKEMHAIRTHARHDVERIVDTIAWPADPSADWCKGFLAGIFDAEGSLSQTVLRISNTDASIIAWVTRCLERLGFDSVVESRVRERPIHNVRIRGGLREHWRFLHTVDPAITRKRNVEGQALKHSTGRLGVVSIEPLGVSLPMYDITTGTGDFVANGVISHNCYARPSHEYLGFGAGTDFDTQIVVKPEAPALLRAAFDRPSWRGDMVMFSGVTDCYQPLEASYRLTRGCLEVCLEYRNPVGIITKAALIERDVELLAELHRAAHASVSISIPFWDKERARAIEAYVTTPERRVRTIERLAAAGIPVGVMVAPIIPGLNDQDIGAILTAARAAGARHAGMVLLRLPGSVKAVFEERLRARLPLAADKVLHRIRDTRGGKLYDARFGSRQTGEGEYAETIQTFFDAMVRKLGFPGHDEERRDTFRRPPRGQLTLDL